MAEKKEYRSAIRSRRLIHQAFLELLREKPFEKITVTDIVKRADINRSTFYAHYPDVMGLVDEIINKVLNDSIELIKGMEFHEIFTDPTRFLSGLRAIGEEHMELYQLLGKSDFALKQVENIKSSLLEKALGTVDIPENIRSSKAFQIQIGFFIGGMLNIYQLWMQGNLDCTPEEINEQIATLIVNNADTYRNWENQ